MFSCLNKVGKQLRGSFEGRPLDPLDAPSSTNCKKCPIASISNSDQHVILDYIISHSGHDERPYLKVKIFGKTFLGLLDSGATRTIMGENGWEILRSFGVSLDVGDSPNCSVANGNICESLGSASIPIELKGKIKIVDVLIVPTLKHSLILGLDFWKMMGIVPNLNQDCWEFSCDEVEVQKKSENQISDLTDDQKNTLGKFVEEKFELQGDRLG